MWNGPQFESFDPCSQPGPEWKWSLCLIQVPNSPSIFFQYFGWFFIFFVLFLCHLLIFAGLCFFRLFLAISFFICLFVSLSVCLADAKSTSDYSSDLLFLGNIIQLWDLRWHSQSNLSKSEICNVGGLQYVQKINHFQPFSLFYNFFEHILEHINAPLSDLSWNTDKCRPED